MNRCKKRERNNVEKQINQKNKTFSLFTCTKEEFKKWFDPL